MNCLASLRLPMCRFLVGILYTVPVAIAAGTILGSAQEPIPASGDQQSAYRLHTTSRLVVLDVVVLDKSGNPVPDLDASQFTVLEDGVSQKLRSFESSHSMEVAGGKQPVVHGTDDLVRIGSAPVDVLVFDELNTRFEDMAYGREEMKKYLMRLPEVLPVPTQLVAAGDARFVVLHDYTQSRADLLEALRTHLPQYPWQMMRNQVGDGALERMAQTLGILGQISDASRGTRGRKNVVWVGTGYPTVDTTQFDEDDQAKMLAVIKTVTARMMESRVTLYMVDPAGVHGQQQEDTDSDGAASTGSSDNGLGPYAGKLNFSNFAAATGGEIFSGRNDLDREIDKGLRDGTTYYTLSYAPTGTSDASAPYRKIRVKMKDPSLHAITREGYFSGPTPVEPPPAKNEKPSQQLRWDIAAAAQTSLAYNGLDVKAVQENAGYQLTVVANGLSWNDQPDGTRQAEVTVMAVWFNAKDKELGHDARELKENIRAEDHIENGRRAGFKFPLITPKGATRVRFVVRDAATGRMGSVDVRP